MRYGEQWFGENVRDILGACNVPEFYRHTVPLPAVAMAGFDSDVFRLLFRSARSNGFDCSLVVAALDDCCCLCSTPSEPYGFSDNTRTRDVFCFESGFRLPQYGSVIAGATDEECAPYHRLCPIAVLESMW